MSLADGDQRGDKKSDVDDSSPSDDKPTEPSSGSQLASPESDSLSSNIRISDAGIYSLCGLTSILFHQLYSEESNR